MKDAWPTTPSAHLRPGHHDEVIQASRDFDRGEHAVGERWTFIGSSFLPYDAGLSLFVIIGDKRRQTRTQWRDEEQGPIIDHLQNYVRAA